MDRISLNSEAFEGENNAYVVEGSDDLALVDTGVGTDDVRDQLREGLTERGYAFADVDAIVLTHFHPDHAGLAGEIQAESDATVYVHEADAPLVAREAGDVAAFDERRLAALEAWGVPDAKRDELLAFLEGASRILGEPASVTRIADGDTIDVGGHALDVVHAPGHTAGLCCFEIADRNEAFVGDAILPVYTPNVGGADVRVERPLATYIDSLQRIADRDYDRLWPGHRDPIDEPTARIREIVDHHRDRTERVVDVLTEYGPADAWTVSAHLFGDLEGIHIKHGPGEAYAHLDHLVAEDVATVDDGEYRLRGADEIDLETLIPTIRGPGELPPS
ncbi:MBL fold metallo-hydrolase [Halobacteria archaeon AArc-dxtr1]|nr:MBL fold metallo-hydrolase [Halobacteria archaeon AArc-dxtr1]